jgi:N12 class adenine-specific DNA methylase
MEGFRKPFGVKEAERLKTRSKRAWADQGQEGRNNFLTFEQMGVDDLTVDEAHEFQENLFYTRPALSAFPGLWATRKGRRRSFRPSTPRSAYLRESPTGSIAIPDRTRVSATAPSRMYTMMRYLAANELAELGLEHFDAWMGAVCQCRLAL